MDELSQNDHVIADHFLGEPLYSQVRAYFLDNLAQFSPAGVGALDQNAIHKEIRNDLTYWLNRDKDSALSGFWNLLEETVGIFNRYCFLSLSGDEFHFAAYPPGGHYEAHLDQFRGRNNRIISMIIYLNDDWKQGDGGELEIYRKDGSSFLVEPIADRCVMFKSAEVLHKVVESRTDRYSLTGWLLHRPGILGQILE